jgi:hypothetical protein
VVELVGHVSKSQRCLSKPKVDGWICHPFTSFKNHGTTCDYSFWIPMLQHFFNLWIYGFRHDTFVHVTMGLFETIDTLGVAMVM